MKHNAKRLISCTLAALMAVLLIASVFAPTANAADLDHRNYRKYKTTIRLTGREAEGHYELNTKDLYLFSLEGAAPGDTWYGSVKVENTTDTIMAVSVHSIESTLKQDTALFEALDLRISVAGETAYRGTYAADSGPVTEAFLLEPDRVMFFDIKVSFPTDADNSLQGRQMDSTWTFKAVFLDQEPKVLDYLVHYVDQSLTPLLPDKLGHGYHQEIITEYAASIPDYVPDAQAKQLLLLEGGFNELYFVYTPKTQPTTPGSDPTPPGISAPLDPSDDINTGFNLMSSNTFHSPYLYIALLALIAITLTGYRFCKTQQLHSRNHIEKEDH